VTSDIFTERTNIDDQISMEGHAATLSGRERAQPRGPFSFRWTASREMVLNVKPAFLNVGLLLLRATGMVFVRMQVKEFACGR